MFARASSNNCLTSLNNIFYIKLKKNYFSDSPSHFDTRSLLETEIKVEPSASVATAFAMYDFPVPGGPNNKIPRHGFRDPKKIKIFLKLISV